MRDKYNAWELYRDPRDPRLIVPKRNPGFGWTINLGHRFGRAALMAILALAAAAGAGSLLRR